jgi:hexosaminidase
VAYGDKWDVYAMEPPAGQLKLAEPEVVSFIKRLFDDLLPRLLSSNFHVGCDELNLQSYLLEPGLETADRQKLKPYVQAFFDHVFGLLERYGRTPVAWEEIILDWDLRLPKSAIIQSWRSQESLAHIAARGHRAIFGPSSHWYLDCGFGTWADPEPGNPQTKVRPPFPDWW